MRGQITQESYKNAFNSSQSSVWKKYLCTKGGDLKVLVFTVNLCQPVFWEKNVVSFGKQRRAERWRGVACDKDNIAQWDIPCHSHSSSSCIALQRTPVRLATCVCLCWISQMKGNKTPLWAAGLKAVQIRSLHSEVFWVWSERLNTVQYCYCQRHYCNTSLWNNQNPKLWHMEVFPDLMPPSAWSQFSKTVTNWLLTK